MTFGLPDSGSSDVGLRNPNFSLMRNLENVVVIPLYYVIDNIYKLLTHAPGLRSTAFCIPLTRRFGLRLRNVSGKKAIAIYLRVWR